LWLYGTDEGIASTTDPSARRMKMGDGGTRPAYNVEFSTDLKSLVIVGADLINIGSDAVYIRIALALPCSGGIHACQWVALLLE